MKIYSLYLYQKGADGKMKLVDSANDFNDIGFLYRKNAIEICDFAAQQMADGSNMNTYITAEENKFLISMYRMRPNVAILIAVDKEYPSRAAFNILREIGTEYETNHLQFPNGKSAVMKKAIVEYQNPANADKIKKIQENLDDIQKIMVTNLEEAIGRGQKINELAEKSEHLSESSKMFLRDSKKLNRCCG
ncbi:SNARE protein, putative [Trichomonas vaginalis G3]|uniref:SNARE protein, putative n=1 Tax=Trichomonas vaginalis (strain ATCC PRA-98 / G3) TaxID=412133 RepID=A2DIP8_TRIV3|nr:SNAP receptor protein [Trichomonas vaginalis G3]EAY19661.1 SNARE protein, putative [Trichomonas vaginalis G3]KAI5521319.1 SNAP receptor protein [Trichomonas vaginalis G3]|eukprot:XP_001580647.1 SNARE protein [Trichomonas vaginalis G3]